MIVTYYLKGLDNAAILQFSNDIVPIHRTKNFSRLSVQTAGFATWKTDTKPPVLTPLLDIVEDRLFDITQQRRPISWWYVGLPKGAMIHKHDHHLSDWSAVYYPMSSFNGGELVFDDCEPIQPREGMLVCFPGSAMHSVTDNQSDKERISLAFNRVMI